MPSMSSSQTNGHKLQGHAWLCVTKINGTIEHTSWILDSNDDDCYYNCQNNQQYNHQNALLLASLRLARNTFSLLNTAAERFVVEQYLIIPMCTHYTHVSQCVASLTLFSLMHVQFNLCTMLTKQTPPISLHGLQKLIQFKLNFQTTQLRKWLNL